MLKKLKRKMKNYVSDEDQFIHQFDHQHRQRSPSQQKEVAKHARIFRLRDRIVKANNDKKIWDDF